MDKSKSMFAKSTTTEAILKPMYVVIPTIILAFERVIVIIEKTKYFKIILSLKNGSKDCIFETLALIVNRLLRT